MAKRSAIDEDEEDTFPIERLTVTEEGTLSALARYRFLTVDQLHRLGVSSNKGHLYTTLRDLKTRKVIKDLDFGVLPGKGRLSRLHHLTPAGAELIDVDPPPRIRLFNSDFFHRLHCIDFQIAVRQWAESVSATVDFFHTYYEGSKTERGGFHPRSRVAFAGDIFVPDALFAFTTSDGVQRLCAFELYNARHTGRVEEQLTRYVAALKQEAIEKACDYDNLVRVLVVFEDPEGELLARNRLASRADFLTAADQFYFKSRDEVSSDFVNGWHQLHHQELAPLF